MRMRRFAVVALGATAAITLAACNASSGGSPGTTTTTDTGTTVPGTTVPGTTTGGGQSGGGTSTSGTTTGSGTLKVNVGTFPDNLDPSIGYTTQAVEADNMVYEPLVGYSPQEGTAGTQLIPILAKALPTVSSDGLTYKLTLKSGLKYSDGSSIKAADFVFAIKRAIKLSWGGDSFFTGYIKGAADYAAGKAQGISGITTDNSTGDITITLTQPYGAFANVIAFPAAAPLPSSTAMKPLPNTPPIGDGPYKFGNIQAGNSYTLVQNPMWASNNISSIPAGYVANVAVTVNSNTVTEAQEVLNNQSDVFDPADALPAEVLPQVQSQAADRYKVLPLATTYYFFMNTQVAPFNNKQARLAVNMAMDRTALARLSSGQLTPGCFFLPPTIVGHQSGNCSFGDPSQVPSDATVAKAKQMIQNAGLAGTKVTVWSETRSPRQEFCTYLNGLLNNLGFKSTLKVLADTSYFDTIGTVSNHAQIGFADWSQDFPNPSDFYLLLSKSAIQATHNENFGLVDDPKIESALKTLNAVPATKLSSYQKQWANLDTYVADQGYTATYGYSTAPKFFSTNVDFATAVVNPVDYLEFNTVKLNS